VYSEDEPQTQARKIDEVWWLTALGCLAAIFFASRLFSPGNDVTNWREAAFWWMVWKDFAHILIVGVPIGMIIAYRPVYLNNKPDNRFRWAAFWIMMVPSLLELLMAILYPHGR
jgi:hypothetical protein